MRMDVSVPADLHPFVAGVAASLDFGFTRMKAAIADLTPEQLAKKPEAFHNAIATLVFHVAGSEISFAHRIIGAEVPADLKAEYMLDVPHAQGLPAPASATAESLTAQLTKAHQLLLANLARVTEADLAREIPFGPDRQVTLRWMLALLPNHAAQHMGHIQLIKQHL
ncbi:MAG: DinB family protein [Mycobacterium leprae]